ncbi:tape measure protein [Brevibacillus borstelensis]|uniref:tape measure protein n=1 Tax=Brevibacillus borstelensis TaxID=45462 RepID=UPI0030BB55D6
MATVTSTLKMFDALSGPLKGITQSLNMTISAMQSMQNAANNNVKIDKTLVAAKQQLAKAETEIRRQIENSTKEQERFNRSVGKGKKGVSELLQTLKGVMATYLTLNAAQGIAKVSDDYINTQARIKMINDGLQTAAELQEKIFASANRSRGSYTDMAAVIGRMGVLAKDAFKNNEELLAFTELMQKSFRVGGSSTMEQQAGMYQLSQAMAAGKLQGDEFRSIMENAPLLAESIAKFTNKSKGDLKTMSADGTITADIIKGAMFAAADEINKKFEEMPKTFGDVLTRLKNSAVQYFAPAIEKMNEMLNNEKVQQNITSLGKLFGDAAIAAIGLLNAVGYVYNFVSTNWAVIEPILWGIVAAIGAWKIAQIGLNIAMMANPIGITIMLIAGLIGVIVFLVKWFINAWETNDQFAAGLLRAWNSVLNFFDQVPIFFMKVGFGIINAFETARVESLKLMEDLVNGLILRINKLITHLNKIPGVSIDAINKVEFTVRASAEAEAIKKAGDKAIAAMELSASKKAAEREQKVLNMLDDRAAKRANAVSELEKGSDKGFDFGKFKIGLDSIDKVGEVGKIKNKVDISSEDLKTMRELAEMKNIQNFVTLQPQFTFGDTHIKQDGRSVDEIIANITDRLEEDIVASAKMALGV